MARTPESRHGIDRPIAQAVLLPRFEPKGPGILSRGLASFPEDVRTAFGHALHEAQCGLEPHIAKALKGFGGRSILELIEDHDGDTYRAVYTARFSGTVYVLHCFQKAKTGIATPRHDIDLIRARLRAAESHHRARLGTGA